MSHLIRRSGRTLSVGAAVRLIPGHARYRLRRYTGTLSFYRCWDSAASPHSPADCHRGHPLENWHRWAAIALLAYIYLAVAAALHRQRDTRSGPDAELVPITVPELLRLLRGTVIPSPQRDKAHRLHWSTWRRRHQH